MSFTQEQSLFEQLVTMVVKCPVSSSQRTAQRLLRKYRGVARKTDSADSYWRLKKLVPAISKKENISKLDVVLEAISYIQRLQTDLESAFVSRNS